MEKAEVIWGDSYKHAFTQPRDAGGTQGRTRGSSTCSQIFGFDIIEEICVMLQGEKAAAPADDYSCPLIMPSSAN